MTKVGKVDFSNAFVQAPLKEDIYGNLSQMFSSTLRDEKEAMKLNLSIYGLVQAPLYWYMYLTEKLGACGLNPRLRDRACSMGNIRYVWLVMMAAYSSPNIMKLLISV